MTLIVSCLLLTLISCNSKSNVTKDYAQNTQIKYIDKGTISLKDTNMLDKINDELDLEITNDQSYVYLRKDNYRIDQFSCVVEGSYYYRLTNIHTNSTITGYVRKSWVYNNETISEDVPFTLKPKEWKTFGCFYVTRSQPITFKISSNFLQ